MLVVDAAVVITACLAEAGFEPLAKEQLMAPHLMWSEASSVLHELSWRREISRELAAIGLERLASSDISPRRPKGRLLKTDSKLKASASRLISVIGPTEV